MFGPPSTLLGIYVSELRYSLFQTALEQGSKMTWLDPINLIVIIIIITTDFVQMPQIPVAIWLEHVRSIFVKISETTTAIWHGAFLFRLTGDVRSRRS